MKEFYITDDGIQLHAKLDMPEEKEKCPLVIVFHGLTGNMEERRITAVSNAMNEIGFATLRVELYGHGKSGGAFEQHNLMKWINNAMTVTDYAKTLDFVTDLYICGSPRLHPEAVLCGDNCRSDAGPPIPPYPEYAPDQKVDQADSLFLHHPGLQLQETSESPP